MKINKGHTGHQNQPANANTTGETSNGISQRAIPAIQFNRSLQGQSASPVFQAKSETNVVQRALPINKADYYASKQAQIDGARNPASIAILRNLDYVVHVVKPFLENRKDLILSYEDNAENLWKSIEKQLKPFSNYWDWAKDENNCEVFTSVASDEKVAPLIALADRLKDMHTVPELAGGYAADAGIRPGMAGLQKTMTDLSDGGTVHSGRPNVEGLPVPVITHGTFMNSETIPAALKRLVKDIHFHWKIGVPLDTRTDQQKTAKTKTPDTAGALRTWHMNEHASLPAINEPALDHPLHQHYSDNSQAGNVHDGEEPIGYAEYTGIDSDQNKIILNYENGHVFVTAVHYQYWYDMPGKAPHKTSGSLDDARRDKPADATEEHIRSPWIRVEMN